MVCLLVFLFWATSPSPFPYEPKLKFSVCASPNGLGLLLGTQWSCSATVLPPPLSQPGPGWGGTQTGLGKEEQDCPPRWQ